MLFGHLNRKQDRKNTTVELKQQNKLCLYKTGYIWRWFLSNDQSIILCLKKTKLWITKVKWKKTPITCQFCPEKIFSRIIKEIKELGRIIPAKHFYHQFSITKRGKLWKKLIKSLTRFNLYCGIFFNVGWTVCFESGAEDLYLVPEHFQQEKNEMQMQKSSKRNWK